MITREQVADLRPGDVVELRGYPRLKEAVVSGPVWGDGESKKLCVGPFIIRHRDGTAPTQYEDDPEFFLTVISRAPRPLYVNHDRSEPVAGDVVRDADSGHNGVWLCTLPESSKCWAGSDDRYYGRGALPDRLRLLVDGETGQVVP